MTSTSTPKKADEILSFKAWETIAVYCSEKTFFKLGQVAKTLREVVNRDEVWLIRLHAQKFDTGEEEPEEEEEKKEKEHKKLPPYMFTSNSPNDNSSNNGKNHHLAKYETEEDNDYDFPLTNYLNEDFSQFFTPAMYNNKTTSAHLYSKRVKTNENSRRAAYSRRRMVLTLRRALDEFHAEIPLFTFFDEKTKKINKYFVESVAQDALSPNFKQALVRIQFMGSNFETTSDIYRQALSEAIMMLFGNSAFISSKMFGGSRSYNPNSVFSLTDDKSEALRRLSIDTDIVNCEKGTPRFAFLSSIIRKNKKKLDAYLAMSLSHTRSAVRYRIHITSLLATIAAFFVCKWVCSKFLAVVPGDDVTNNKNLSEIGYFSSLGTKFLEIVELFPGSSEFPLVPYVAKYLSERTFFWTLFVLSVVSRRASTISGRSRVLMNPGTSLTNLSGNSFLVKGFIVGLTESVAISTYAFEQLFYKQILAGFVSVPLLAMYNYFSGKGGDNSILSVSVESASNFTFLAYPIYHIFRMFSSGLRYRGFGNMPRLLVASLLVMPLGSYFTYDLAVNYQKGNISGVIQNFAIAALLSFFQRAV